MTRVRFPVARSKSPGHLTRECLGFRFHQVFDVRVRREGQTTQDRTRSGRRSIAELSCSQVEALGAPRRRRPPRHALRACGVGAGSLRPRLSKPPTVPAISADTLIAPPPRRAPPEDQDVPLRASSNRGSLTTKPASCFQLLAPHPHPDSYRWAEEQKKLGREQQAARQLQTGRIPEPDNQEQHHPRDQRAKYPPCSATAPSYCDEQQRD